MNEEYLLKLTEGDLREFWRLAYDHGYEHGRRAAEQEHQRYATSEVRQRADVEKVVAYSRKVYGAKEAK